MCVPNFRSIGITVEHAEWKQTHTQTEAAENITSSVNTGGKNVATSGYKDGSWRRSQLAHRFMT